MEYFGDYFMPKDLADIMLEYYDPIKVRQQKRQKKINRLFKKINQSRRFLEHFLNPTYEDMKKYKNPKPKAMLKLLKNHRKNENIFLASLGLEVI